MNKLFLVAFVLLFLAACNNNSVKENGLSKISEQAQNDSLSQGDNENSLLFQDQGMSSFKLLQGDTVNGFEYETVEIKYKFIYIQLEKNQPLANYMAKFVTTTKGCTGCEGEDRTIHVDIKPMDNLEKTIMEIEHQCDLVEFGAHDYKITKYGCCESGDELEIFDYQKKSIIQADDHIVSASFPNSEIHFYLGYQMDTQDSPFLGTVVIAYNSAEKYMVHVPTPTNFNDYCRPFVPEIEIVSNNNRDNFNESENEYNFWSLEKIESTEEINGLEIKLTFDCDEEFGNKTIRIPLTNGLPFGKDSHEQEVSFP